jgi:hypothetical protein
MQVRLRIATLAFISAIISGIISGTGKPSGLH